MDRIRGHLTQPVVRIHPSPRIKILSLGATGSGKSCIIKRYCEGRFVPEYITTIGIDYGVKDVVHSDTPIKVNFWDVAGDQVYFDVRNEFYKDTQGVMLVYDVTSKESFKALDAWVTELKRFEDRQVFLVIVGNKIDLPRVISKEEGKEWADKRRFKYFEVSANTGEGIQEMFESLFGGVLKMLRDSSDMLTHPVAAPPTASVPHTPPK